MTPPRRARTCFAAVLAAFALSACTPPPGGDTAPDGATGGTSAPATATGQATADPAATDDGRTLLDVVVRADETADPVHYVLACEGAEPRPATNHPRPEAACADVAELGAEFFTAERDPNVACTQQYGGPQTAHVVGTVDDQSVDTEFSRTDGCEISRWDAVESLLGPGGVQEDPAAPVATEGG